MNLLKILLLATIIGGCVSFGFAQQIRISGSVTSESDEPLSNVNVLIKHTAIGTVSDKSGHFYFEYEGTLPFVLLVSIVGYKTSQFEIKEHSTHLEIVMLKQAAQLDEVLVYSPSRTEENLMQSPVSVEQMSLPDITNNASDDYYKSVAALKGVDMKTSSINFQSINTRGFPAGVRFVHLVDGVDVQSPALNRAFGNANGPTFLDVENIELIPGAASALYGPNAYNGMILMKTKNPFEHQGLSAYVKLGFNHFGSNPELGEPSSPQPIYEAAVRYAKVFKQRFAIKLNFSGMLAQDWHANNYSDRNAFLQGDLLINPAYDGVNLYGDDGGFNLGFMRNSQDLINSIANATGLGADTVAPYVNSLPAQTVNRTGYPEYTLIEYNARHIRFAAALNYRTKNNIELGYSYNYAGGNSVLAGGQRIAVKNSSTQIHQLHATAENWNLFGYANFTDNGDSYSTEFSGYAINNAYLDNGSWYGTYAGGFAGGLIEANITNTGSPVYDTAFINSLLNDPETVSLLHAGSRGVSDAGRWEPGSPEFERARDSINDLIMPYGSKFYNKTRFYHVEGQYNFKNQINIFSLIIGAHWRMYDLRTDGLIYIDSKENPVHINEFGGYIYLSKTLINDQLKLEGSLRLDKSKNFELQFSPRISAVYTFLRNHNIRASFQTGFRNPTVENQYVNLDLIGWRLVGGLQQFHDQYSLSDWVYTLHSVNAFSESVARGAPNPSLLVQYTSWSQVRPEQIKVFEAGYRGTIANRLLIDIYYYYNIYTDFISHLSIRQSQDENGEPTDPFSDPDNQALFGLLSGNADNTFSFPTNNPETVKSNGVAIGLDYVFYKSYQLGLNYTWNRLIEGEKYDIYQNDYNTPEHVVNVTFGNTHVNENVGFNIAWRWQNTYNWYPTPFNDNKVPAFSTFDAQFTYRFIKPKIAVRLGGSNIFNNRHISFYSGPTLGAIYYLMVIFNQ